MDPYLETCACWPDFHSTFIHAWSEAIADKLPDEYDARLGERPYAPEADPEIRRLMHAVPRVPLEIIDHPRELYIRVVSRKDQSLSAVLELLSLSNKNECPAPLSEEQRAWVGSVVARSAFALKTSHGG
jgi:Protein of unknown function (DUF4058)